MKKDEILYFQAIKYMQDLLSKPNFDEELEKILEEINFYRDKTGELPAFYEGEEPVFDSTENFRCDILSIHIPELVKENNYGLLVPKQNNHIFNQPTETKKIIPINVNIKYYLDNTSEYLLDNTSEYLKAA